MERSWTWMYKTIKMRLKPSKTISMETVVRLIEYACFFRQCRKRLLCGLQLILLKMPLVEAVGSTNMQQKLKSRRSQNKKIDVFTSCTAQKGSKQKRSATKILPARNALSSQKHVNGPVQQYWALVLEPKRKTIIDGKRTLESVARDNNCMSWTCDYPFVCLDYKKQFLGRKTAEKARVKLMTSV